MSTLALYPPTIRYDTHMRIQKGVPLAPLTTFNIGGLAREFVEVKSIEEIREALAYAHDKSLPYYILAGASNVLIPTKGYDGLIIHIQNNTYDIQGTTLIADAGCDLFTLIRATADAGLSGWESMAGIPGSLGGAIRGNAGAFGTEIIDILENVTAYNTHTKEEKTFTYRDREKSTS